MQDTTGKKIKLINEMDVLRTSYWTRRQGYPLLNHDGNHKLYREGQGHRPGPALVPWHSLSLGGGKRRVISSGPGQGKNPGIISTVVAVLYLWLLVICTYGVHRGLLLTYYGYGSQ